MNISVTSQNALIQKMAVVFQESRIILEKENNGIQLSDDTTRRIVALGILSFEHIISQHNENTITPITVSDLCLSLCKDSSLIAHFFQLEAYQDCKAQNMFNHIKKVSEITEWETLLVYSFEVFEYTPSKYLNTPQRRGARLASSTKKRGGIYYTPSDVAKYMVEHCIDVSNSLIPYTYLDCSCGTGVFLLQILEYYRNNRHFTSVDDCVRLIETSIWGIDISYIAVESCRWILLLYMYLNFDITPNQLPRVWSSISNSIFCGDSTQLYSVFKQHPWMPQSYSCIIGNPPYVSSKEYGNLFVPFVMNMIEYSDSRSALVLPLSIVYSSNAAIVNLRKKMLECHCEWDIINFDRSPDSLFGDQVKTRNTILLCSKTKDNTPTLRVSGLIRWATQYRKMLFQNIKVVDVTGIVDQYSFPKISNETEKKAFESIMLSDNQLNEILSTSDRLDNNTVFINGTSYNWICAYDTLPPSIDENNNPYISPSMITLNTLSADDRYFVIAMLCNRITYWLWTVTSDAFHVKASFVKNLCYSKKQFHQSQIKNIVALGKAYCEKIKKAPTISYNARKTIVNYDHFVAIDIISKIETIICESYSIPEFVDYIAKWYTDQVECGRSH